LLLEKPSFLLCSGHVTQDRVHVTQSNNPARTDINPIATTQQMVPRRSDNANKSAGKFDRIERATSPVDQRILNEFYGDRPKEQHTYQLDGRQYIVYEGKTFTSIEPIRKGKCSTNESNYTVYFIVFSV